MRIQNDVGVHGNRKNSPINSIFPHSLRGLSISLSLFSNSDLLCVQRGSFGQAQRFRSCLRLEPMFFFFCIGRSKSRAKMGGGEGTPYASIGRLPRRSMRQPRRSIWDKNPPIQFRPFRQSNMEHLKNIMLFLFCPIERHIDSWSQAQRARACTQ